MKILFPKNQLCSLVCRATVVWVAAGTVVSPAAVRGQEGDLPTAAEAAAMYQQNANLPSALRVRGVLERLLLDGRKNDEASLSRKLKAALDNDEVPPEMMDEVLNRIRRAEEAEAADDKYRMWYEVFDYWTDFTSFQIRILKSADESPTSYGSFPDDSAFPERLLQGRDLLEHLNINAVSYGPATDYRFRNWTPRQEGPQLSSVDVTNPLHSSLHIPLVMPPQEWGASPNPCDAFYLWLRAADPETRVGPADSEFGPDVILVAARDSERTARAFLDLSAGAIPRRIEWFPWRLEGPVQEPLLLYPGRCETTAELTADRIVTVDRIETVDCDGHTYFCPAAGKEIEYSRAADPRDAISELQPEIAAHRLLGWKITSVVCNPDVASDDFALRFPPQTVFHDGATGETFVTSDVEGQLTRLADSAITLSRQPSRRWWPWILALAGATVIGTFVVWRRYRA